MTWLLCVLAGIAGFYALATIGVLIGGTIMRGPPIELDADGKTYLPPAPK